MSKLMTLLAIATAAVLLGSHFIGGSVEDKALQGLFRGWMLKNGKQYSHDEFVFRFNQFKKNAEYVRAHNARHAEGLESFDLELNHFADMDSKEFAEKYLMKVDIKQKAVDLVAEAVTVAAPDTVDWTSSGAVTPIKNQGQCGSCWAFSTTGSVEGAKFLKDGVLASYSEQQLVDCSGSYGNQGCNGGLMDNAFHYIVDNGIALESAYPYKAVTQKCSYNSSLKAFGLSKWTDVTADKESTLVAAIAQQPVSVAIEANHASFQLYKSGVYDGLCGTALDHGVLAVGYGNDSASKKNYYKVKNSWGSGWGANGYILIARNGDGKGKCGIQMVASYAVA